MKIKIDLKFLLFALLFYFTKQIYIYLIIMIFCFIHELAHIFLAICLGFKINYIKLLPFGFCCDIRPNFEDYDKKILNSNIVELKNIFIAFVGPFLNLVLAIILSIYFRNVNNYDILVYSNIVIIVLNFLPIIPLDGANILKSIFKILYGRNIANRIMYYVTNIVIILLTFLCSFLILYFENISIILILGYLWYLVINQNNKYKLNNDNLK